MLSAEHSQVPRFIYCRALSIRIVITTWRRRIRQRFNWDVVAGKKPLGGVPQKSERHKRERLLSPAGRRERPLEPSPLFAVASRQSEQKPHLSCC